MREIHWVRIDGEWTVGQYFDGEDDDQCYWLLFGSDQSFSPLEADEWEIGEELPPPAK